MAETPEDKSKLAARLAALAGPPKPKSRVNPYLLSAVTAVAGIGLGAYLVAFAPEPDPGGTPVAASTSAEFQDGAGIEDFQISQKSDAVPQVPSTAPDPELEKLRATVAALEAELTKLRANPETVKVADDAALQALRDQIAEVEAKAAERETALSTLQQENDRLQAQIEAGSLLNDQANAEAEAREEAQVNSDMIAFRDSAGGGEEASDGDAGRYSGDEAFRRAGADKAEVRQSEVIANPGHTIMQGTLIEAALETALSSDLQGNVVAQVSHDVWSFDMSQVLIPRGSKLFGRYDSDVDLGQRRVLIAWDRLVTTDGQSVELAAYGTDRVGRSGLPAKVRSHFLQRFGSAALISIIGAAPAVAANIKDEAVSDAAQNVGDGFTDAVGTVVGDYLTIAPTLSVDQGAIVMIRVDADLELF
ncbi:TrbI/VirB10 family protein [Tabrizicola oligotrophica]|uniref:Conjugal transfer protein n=1 Tax=Tabrizicola oligotrophica TaxID=2710650 RepID=A0A6M0QX29_9RHOB|nr:TrbI/VirB10 family protein [Tabrizicola oligotrophica]NEY92015.1 conjugal transfer protein [Tabrizicola oligotrophica]